MCNMYVNGQSKRQPDTTKPPSHELIIILSSNDKGIGGCRLDPVRIRRSIFEKAVIVEGEVCCYSTSSKTSIDKQMGVDGDIAGNEKQTLRACRESNFQ